MSCTYPGETRFSGKVKILKLVKNNRNPLMIRKKIGTLNAQSKNQTNEIVDDRYLVCRVFFSKIPIATIFSLSKSNSGKRLIFYNYNNYLKAFCVKTDFWLNRNF